MEVNLAHTPGSNQVFGDMNLPDKFIHIAPENIKYLHANNCNLCSLQIGPTSTLSEVVRYITTLSVSHNNLRTFQGMEQFTALQELNASHNNFDVIDVHDIRLLTHLPSLHNLDLSHNRLVTFSLDLGDKKKKSTEEINNVGSMNVNSTTRRSTESLHSTTHLYSNGNSINNINSVSANGVSLTGTPYLFHLTSLNLAHNALIELPDVRAAPQLKWLNVGYNNIKDLSDITSKLPLVHLETLFLHCNKLPTFTSLIPLSALCETLQEVCLYGNPFTRREKSDLDGNVEKSNTVGNGKLEINQLAKSHSANDSQFLHTTNTNSNTSLSGEFFYWWRPFVLWLAPMLHSIDTINFSFAEYAAVKSLFRERGKVSSKLIELLNTRRSGELFVYLQKECGQLRLSESAIAILANLSAENNLTNEDNSVNNTISTATTTTSPSATTVTTAVAVNNNNNTSYNNADIRVITTTNSNDSGKRMLYNKNNLVNNGKSPAPPHRQHYKSTSPIPFSMESVESLSVSGVEVHSSISNIVRALQEKMKRTDKLLKILWLERLAKLSLAATVIQKHIRGALTRMHLTNEMRAKCKQIRKNLNALYSNNINKTAQVVMPVLKNGMGVEEPKPELKQTEHEKLGEEETQISAAVYDQNCNMQSVLESMRMLKEVMSDMWSDLDVFRAFVHREQRRAALCIQQHYRKYRARVELQWRRSEYNKFVHSLSPFVCRMQNAGRGYVARRKFAEFTNAEREQCELKAKVYALESQMHVMRGILEQVLQSQRRYQIQEESQSPQEQYEDEYLQHEEQESEEHEENEEQLEEYERTEQIEKERQQQEQINFDKEEEDYEEELEEEEEEHYNKPNENEVNCEHEENTMEISTTSKDSNNEQKNSNEPKAAEHVKSSQSHNSEHHKRAKKISKRRKVKSSRASTLSAKGSHEGSVNNNNTNINNDEMVNEKEKSRESNEKENIESRKDTSALSQIKCEEKQKVIRVPRGRHSATIKKWRGLQNVDEDENKVVDNLCNIVIERTLTLP